MKTSTLSVRALIRAFQPTTSQGTQDVCIEKAFGVGFLAWSKTNGSS